MSNSSAQQKHEDGQHEAKGQQIEIIVNGRPKPFLKGDISFEEVVGLAFPGQVPTDTISFTVSYSRGTGDKREGTLVAGQTIKVKDGQVFNVGRTDRS